MLAFTVGALLPLLFVASCPTAYASCVTVLSVVAALALTGFVSARIGYSPRLPAVVRNVSGGLLAMGVTYLIGLLAGTSSADYPQAGSRPRRPAEHQLGREEVFPGRHRGPADRVGQGRYGGAPIARPADARS